MDNKWIKASERLPKEANGYFVKYWHPNNVLFKDVCYLDANGYCEPERDIYEWLEETEEPVSNESISEDEVLEAIIHNTFNESWDEAGDCLYSEKECINVAKQYSSSKLEELEKWVNEEIEKLHKLAVLALTDHNNPFTGRANDLKKLKEKIKLLK